MGLLVCDLVCAGHAGLDVLADEALFYHQSPQDQGIEDLVLREREFGNGTIGVYDCDRYSWRIRSLYSSYHSQQRTAVYRHSQRDGAGVEHPVLANEIAGEHPL